MAKEAFFSADLRRHRFGLHPDHPGRPRRRRSWAGPTPPLHLRTQGHGPQHRRHQEVDRKEALITRMKPFASCFTTVLQLFDSSHHFSSLLTFKMGCATNRKTLKTNYLVSEIRWLDNHHIYTSISFRSNELLLIFLGLVFGVVTIEIIVST